MNQHDIDNLNFLMTMKDETAVRAWFKTQSSDDIIYALSLLYAAQLDEAIDEPVMDVSEAQTLLSQFTL